MRRTKKPPSEQEIFARDEAFRYTRILQIQVSSFLTDQYHLAGTHT